MEVFTATYVAGSDLFKDCDAVLDFFYDRTLPDVRLMCPNALLEFDGILLGSMTSLVAGLADAIGQESEEDDDFVRECKVVLARIEALGEVHYFVLDEDLLMKG
jgi:hypothetical protein